MKLNLPLGLKLVIFLQIIPILVLPPSALAGMGIVLYILAVALFALLGYFLWQRRAWARIATVFVQGFSIIIRLLALPGSVISGGELGGPIDGMMVATLLLSMILSGVVLYYVDQPDVQLLMV